MIADRDASLNARETVDRLVRERKGPAQTAVLTRLLHALAEALPQINEKEAGDLAGEASHYGVLLRLLEQPQVLAALRAQDPLGPARVRGLRAREDLLAQEGGTVSADEAATLLGISRQAVDNRRRAGRLLALTLGRRDYRYPLWQFTDGGVLPGLEEVLRDLSVVTPWMRAAFLLNGNYRLKDGERPLDALRQGEVRAVREAAQMYGVHGAA
ncbi:MAG: hypothetical protein NVSMB65_16850 [Chloroflexota bacterium]